MFGKKICLKCGSKTFSLEARGFPVNKAPTMFLCMLLAKNRGEQQQLTRGVDQWDIPSPELSSVLSNIHHISNELLGRDDVPQEIRENWLFNHVGEGL